MMADGLHQMVKVSPIDERFIRERPPFAETPDGCRIVSMLQFKGEVLIATEKAVYILHDGVLTPIPWADK